MKIRDVLKLTKNTKAGNKRIAEISDDSQKVAKGSLFFVIKRPNFNIFSVLERVEKKVVAYVAESSDRQEVEKRIKKKPVIYVPSIDKAFYHAVRRFYQPKKDIKIIGVTGTNGKTTTAYFFYQMLKKLGKNPALFATTGYFFSSTRYQIPYTTADFLTLHKMIKKASLEGVNYLVMEVSSHGIDQKRIRGLKFSLCVFTNLSRDHLDYHKTMQAYFQVKKRFFLDSKLSLAVINKDCRWGRNLLSCLKRRVSYSLKSRADYRIKDIEFCNKRAFFKLLYQKESYRLSANFIGKHNLMNLLAVLAGLSSLRFPLASLLGLVDSLKLPEGRLQEVAEDIFIDYAHTPKGLRLVLLALKGAGYQRIISVFGCGGQRDKGKREAMGKISERFAYFTVITSDNPRSEDPLDICRQVKRGFKSKRFKVILDREEAIKAGLAYKKMAKSNYKKKVCLVIAGKGHEGYQIIKDKKVRFKDARVVKKFLEEAREKDEDS